MGNPLKRVNGAPVPDLGTRNRSRWVDGSLVGGSTGPATRNLNGGLQLPGMRAAAALIDKHHLSGSLSIPKLGTSDALVDKRSLNGTPSIPRMGFAGAAQDTLTFSSITNTQLFLDAYSITGIANGAAVTTWPDGSSSARTVTQSTSSKRPLFQTNGFATGIPAVLFDGVDDRFAITSAIVVNSGFTFYAIIKTTSTRSSQDSTANPSITILGDSSGAVELGWGVTNGHQSLLRWNSTWLTTSGTATVNDGQPHCLIARHNSSTGAITLWTDTTASTDATGTKAFTASNNQVSVVGVGFSGGAADPWDGSLTHVGVISRAISDSEATSLMAALRTAAGF